MRFKEHIQTAAILALLLLVFGFVGQGDYEEALAQEARAKETRR